MKSNELNQEMGFEDALNSEDNKKLAEAMEARFNTIKDDIMSKFEELKDEHDAKVLANRGIRQLTNAELDFYNNFKTGFTNAVQGATVTMPKTIFESVFEDLTTIEEENPLSMIDIVNTTGVTEWVISKSESPVGAWGALGSAITAELNIAFALKSTLDNKYSCFIPVSKDILDLGPQWLDAYVRQYLLLGLHDGLVKAAISGDGANQPVGMAYDYDYATDKATKKTPVVLTAIDKKNFGPIFKTLTTNPMGRHRALNNPTIFVDSESYYDYIFNADSLMDSDKNFVSILDKLGVKVCMCETGLDKGQAVIALPKRYWMSVSMKTAGAAGLVEFSDEAKFLDDIRLYKGKVYGEGMLKDNNAAVLLDLTQLVASI